MNPLRTALSGLAAAAALLGATQAQAATSLPSISNTCWTTEQPFTLVENEFARLTWDVYGNLTLSTAQGNSKQVWGLDSSVPLTGSNAGKLCFGNGAGRLRIHDKTGAEKWNSGTGTNYSAQNGVLSIDECSIKIQDTSGAIQWQEQTAQCDFSRRATPATTQCWSKTETKVLLRNEALGKELLWKDGKLSIRSESGELTQIADTVQQGKICHESNGSLVAYLKSGDVYLSVWDTESITSLSGSAMTLDESGLTFSAPVALPGQSQPHELVYKQKPLPGFSVGSSLEPGVCFDINKVKTVLTDSEAQLDLDGSLGLVMRDEFGNNLWQAHASTTNKSRYFCFQNDGDLVLYRNPPAGSSGTVGPRNWSSGTSGTQDQAPRLTLKGKSLGLIGAKLFDICKAYDLATLKECNPASSCTTAEMFDWSMASAYCTPTATASQEIWSVQGQSSVPTLPDGGFSFVKESRSGNKDFGASIWLVAGALNPSKLASFKSKVAGTGAEDEVHAALPSSTPPTNYVEAIADAGASVTLFKQSKNVMEAIGSVENNDGPKSAAKLLLMGGTVYSHSGDTLVSASFSRDFFEFSQQYFVGGIPITVDVAASGSAGVKGNLDYNWNSKLLTCTLTPHAGIDAEASIGVGFSGFSVGVEGELNLVEVAFPVTEKLNVESFNYESSLDLNLSSLEGELSLYAKAFMFKASKEIVSFDGYSYSKKLLKVQGSLLAATRRIHAMSRRPLLLAVPALLACAIGYVAWPSSSAPARAATPAEPAATTASEPPRAGVALRAANEKGTRATYRLVFEHRASVNGKEAALVALEGAWTTTPRRGGDVEVTLAPERLTMRGDQAPPQEALGAPFTLKMHDGALLALAFSRDTADGARNLLASVATALQWTGRPGDRWVAEETDLTGKYQAIYTREGSRLLRKRGAYTALHGAGGNAQALRSSEDSEFRFDERGLLSASVRLDQTTVLGEGLPSLTMTLRARLVRHEIAEIPLEAPTEREAAPIAPRVDPRAIQQNRRQALVAGARASELIEEVKAASKPDPRDPARARQASRARRRLTALVELEPGASAEVAEAIRKNREDPDTFDQLTGALSSATSPHATNALASLLDEPMDDATRRAVLANIGLANTQTPESVSALSKALDKPEGGNAALALGNAARQLGQEEGAGAVSTLLARYEAATTPAEKQVYLEALANTGSLDVLPVLLQAIGGQDFGLARVGTFGLRLIPGDEADDALWSLISNGSALSLEAIKAAGYREPALWEPRLLKAKELYPSDKRMLEVIQAVLTQWANLKIEPKTSK